MSSSIPERGRSSKEVNFEDSKDRISGLPDEILVHILSFLPTMYGFATRILSTRWRNIWASVPVLDFDNVYFPRYWSSQLNFYVPYGIMKFVSKLLLLHDSSSLSKLRLECYGRLGLGNLHAWITDVVVNHPIQEIDLKIHTNVSCLYLSQSLCTSNTLAVLRLGPKLRIQLPSSVWFPSLKILEISLLQPENNMTQKLLCSCPILEILIVEAFLTEVRQMVLNVVIPTLKRLTIDLSAEEDALYHDYKILLDTPSLERLSLRDDYLTCYSVKNKFSLVKASVKIGQRLFMDGTTDHANRIHDLLKGLSTVKSLSLSYYVMKVLDLADDNNLPVFDNLIHMDMHIQIHMSWPLLLKLLKSTPNLETLELSIVYSNSGDFSDEEFISVASQEVPSCLLSHVHLKEIKVSRYVGRKDEMNLVKYLLKNAKVLQKITIDSSNDRYVKKFQKKLLLLPKGSKSSQIYFS